MADDGWRIGTLKAHLDAQLAQMDRRYEQRFEAQETAVGVALEAVHREMSDHIRNVSEMTTQAFAASEKAIDKAERASEKRFDSVNEFREQARDRDAAFATKESVEGLKESTTARVGALERSAAASGGQQAGSTQSRATLFGVLTLLFALVVIALGLATLIVNHH